MSLVGLTLLTSHGQIFAIHETFVGLWIATNLIHMLTSSYLERKLKLRGYFYKIRRLITFFSLFAAFFMLYFFFRHNSHCEPFIYSYFCLFEYSVIVMNSIYHLIAPPFIEFPIKTVQSCFKNEENPSEEKNQLLSI